MHPSERQIDAYGRFWPRSLSTLPPGLPEHVAAICRAYAALLTEDTTERTVYTLRALRRANGAGRER